MFTVGAPHAAEMLRYFLVDCQFFICVFWSPDLFLGLPVSASLSLFLPSVCVHCLWEVGGGGGGVLCVHVAMIPA